MQKVKEAYQQHTDRAVNLLRQVAASAKRRLPITCTQRNSVTATEPDSWPQAAVLAVEEYINKTSAFHFH